MAKAPPALTADLLVECVEHHAHLRPVTSVDVKNWLDGMDVEWRDRNGWAIKDAENSEFASPDRRLVKWKKDPADSTQMVGYTLESDKVTAIQGWQKIRP